MANDDGVTPGWYADPLRRFELRWFNGVDWTADVADGERRFVDPLGVTAGAAPGNPNEVQPKQRTKNAAASTSMALGIVAVAVSWLPFVVAIGVIAALLAIAFGWVGLRRAGTLDEGRSRAIVGLATGASALGAAAIGIALSIVVLDAYDAYLEPAPHTAVIDDCALAGARASLRGTIENLGDESADFSVLVAFVRVGTDNPHRSTRIGVSDVAPGERRAFEAQSQVELDDVECIVVDVNGPLPFGLTLD